MKKVFEEPEVQTVVFTVEDIITTSGTAITPPMVNPGPNGTPIG